MFFRMSDPNVVLESKTFGNPHRSACACLSIFSHKVGGGGGGGSPFSFIQTSSSPSAQDSTGQRLEDALGAGLARVPNRRTAAGAAPARRRQGALPSSRGRLRPRSGRPGAPLAAWVPFRSHSP